MGCDSLRTTCLQGLDVDSRSCANCPPNGLGHGTLWRSTIHTLPTGTASWRCPFSPCREGETTTSRNTSNWPHLEPLQNQQLLKAGFHATNTWPRHWRRRVPQRQETFVQNPVLLRGGLELCLDKVDMPDGDPQNRNPLFVRRSFSTPHSRVRIHTFSRHLHGVPTERVSSSDSKI